eukprot:CAMPEP_0119423938 /NCGR_PEP_ID=MMETSP1335-20130426/31465_1 /TAXON_ID=259385 /ORGANISM="Chrysoculter rhomboideus, Strain RCC1486" /LENGTH=77 /DNA_ID=CAMNT_0007449445 /DNA_START=75 /DNA_END=306 /DNA_ORIENTATION=-
MSICASAYQSPPDSDVSASVSVRPDACSLLPQGMARACTRRPPPSAHTSEQLGAARAEWRVLAALLLILVRGADLAG